MLVFSHNIVFIESEIALLCVTMRERARVFAATIQCIIFDIAFAIKKFSFCGGLPNAFWHGHEAFPQVSSQNEIVHLLLILQLPYSKYRGVKICFCSCRYENQNFSLVSHSCHSCSTHVTLVSHSCRLRRTCVALVSHSCCSCLTRVALVLLVSHSCRISVAHVARVLLVSGTRVVNQINPVKLLIFIF